MIAEYLTEHWLRTAAAGVGLCAALSGVGYSTFNWHDTTYAKRDAVRLIEMRLEQKILNDRARQTQQRIWQIEDRYHGNVQDAPDTVQEEYRNLIQDLDDINDELNDLRREQRFMQQAPSKYYDKPIPNSKSSR